MNSLAAIILAAGKGTRMKSQRAKVTFPLGGKPMIQRVVDSASQCDCAGIYVVVGYQKESVVACLTEDQRLLFVEQAEQLGTGHAVMMVEPVYNRQLRDVLILCGDVPLLSAATLVRLYEVHREDQAACTVLTAFLDDAGKYGRILRDVHKRVSGIVEYKDATAQQRAIKEWNTGIYCFEAETLFAALRRISNANQQQEYYLTDVVAILHQEGRKISSVMLEDLAEVAGVNSQEQLADLEDHHVGTIRKRWLNSGVVIHNPATVCIGDDVILEPDVEIGQNCVLQGKCLIQSGVVLGPNCYVQNSNIGDNCILEGHNILVNAHLPEGHILDFGEQVIEEELYE